LTEGCCVGVREGQEVIHGAVHDGYQLSHCAVERLELTPPVRHLSDHRAQRRTLVKRGTGEMSHYYSPTLDPHKIKIRITLIL
jgi:hypothetical protein